MNRMKRWVAAACVALITPAVFSACYGSFPLVKTIYKINGQVTVGDRMVTGVVRSVVMILLSWLYAISGIADIVIFNLIEFWTGRPVFTAYQGEDGSRVTMKTLDKNTLQIQIEKEGDTRTYYAFRNEPSKLFILKAGQWVELKPESLRLGDMDLITLRAGNEIIESRLQHSSALEGNELRMLRLEEKAHRQLHTVQ